MRGDIQFMFDLIPGVTAQVDVGQVKALAVSSPVPSQAYPDLPTLEQAGVADIDATNWYGIVAPAGTPQEIIDKMSDDRKSVWYGTRVSVRVDRGGRRTINKKKKE